MIIFVSSTGQRRCVSASSQK